MCYNTSYEKRDNMSKAKYRQRIEYMEWYRVATLNGFDIDKIPYPFNRDLDILEVTLKNLLIQKDINYASEHSKKEIQAKIDELTKIYSEVSSKKRIMRAKKHASYRLHHPERYENLWETDPERYEQVKQAVTQEIIDRHERFSKAR